MRNKSCATGTRDPIEATDCLAKAKPKTHSDDLHESPTVGVVILVLLILLAIVTIIVLAWIGPVVSGDSINAILAASSSILRAILTPASQELDTRVLC
jgi:hypothetical protein